MIPKTMLVAVYYCNHDVRLEERPVPAIGKGEILVKVKASGICGTDVMEWYRIKKAPRILGHEISGDIVQSDSPKYKIGQRVFVSHHVPCYQCKHCKNGNHTACETLHTGNFDPGGYSEFIRVPKINVERGVYVLPKKMSYEEGTMIEPLACAVRGQRVTGIKKGQLVLILGSGISGLLNIRIAKSRGAKVITTDMDEARLKIAKDCGADEVYKPTALPPLKADRAILCTGAMPAVKQAFQSLDRKGTLLLFAIPETDIQIPTVDVWRNEMTVTSSYGAAPEDLEEAIKLIGSGKIPVRDLITHKLPLEKVQEGFRLVAEAKQSLKVVLLP
ncbi:MAG TPA: alcohol dehydrogenase catalytic domain-containing protein [Candidatus Omnitrophota bacterium]|nr:alcohol dehydrogenase catalytic domain-containing protein [Candidatus Omnitrophota bacterium]